MPSLEALPSVECPTCGARLSLGSCVGRYEGTCAACYAPFEAVVFADRVGLLAAPLPLLRLFSKGEPGMCRLVPPRTDSRLTAALKICLSILGAQKGYLQLYDPVQGTLRIAAHKGFGPEFLNKFRQVKPGQRSVCCLALERREMVASEDVFRDDRFPGLRPFFRQEQVRAVISIPMVARGGAVVGVLSAHFAWPHSPGLSDLRLIERYADKLANVLQRERALAAL